MPQAVKTTSTPRPTASRGLGASLLAIVAGAGLTSGIAADAATAAVDLVLINPDAELLSFCAELMTAVDDVSYDENSPEWDDIRLTRTAERLIRICWEIVDAPPARTSAGLTLKAAVAMYQLREGYNCGDWDGDGEAICWNLLSQLAGDACLPPILPARLVANNEPARA